MKFNIHTVGFDANTKLIDLVNKKLNKLDKFSELIFDADTYLKLDHKSQNIKDKVVEIKCNVKGNTLFVKETNKTFEESIDLAVESMSRQIRKHKEKISP